MCQQKIVKRMMNKETTETRKLHSGKWSREEEEYTEALIEDFRAGRLENLQDGTTLRSFLAKKLNCKPKRISKKFEGKDYDGAQLFFKTEEKISPEEARRIREKLQRLEAKFLECQKTIDIVKASRQGHSKDNGGTEAAATSSEPKNLTQLPASLSFHHAATMAGFSPSAATLQIPDGSRERVLNAQRVPSPSASASGLAGMGLSSSSAALNNDLLTRNQRAIDLANNRSFAPYGNSGLPGTSTTLATNSSRRLNYAALNTAPGPIAVNSRYILLEQQAALERARLAVAQNNYSRGIAPAPAGMTNVYNMLPTSLRVATTLDNSSSSLATTGLNGVNQGNSPASLEEQLARMRNQGASPYASDVFASSSYSEERKRQSLEEELGLIRSNASKRQRYF